MGETPDIIEVRALKNYFIYIKFNTGEEKIYDMTEHIEKIKYYEKLKDRQYFENVKPRGDTVEWENGEDVAPEIPSTVEDLWRTFRACESLTSIPEINDNVLYAHGAFYDCFGLEGVVRINTSNLRGSQIFGHDFQLKGQLIIEVPANSTTYNELFSDYGDSTKIIIETF